MSAVTVSYRTPLAVSAADAFHWHARPGALLVTHHGGEEFRVRKKTR